jgi:hypothetical protein
MLGDFLVLLIKETRSLLTLLKMRGVMLSFIIYCTSTVEEKSLCDTLGVKQTGEERWGGGEIFTIQVETERGPEPFPLSPYTNQQLQREVIFKVRALP